MGLPIYQIETYQKALPQSKTYRHHSKIPTLVLATGKHQKSAKKLTKSKKNIKTFEQTLQY